MFLAAAGWAGVRVFGGDEPPSTQRLTDTAGSGGDATGAGADARDPAAAQAGRAFLAAWAGRHYDRMQELVEDPSDDMTRVYGGLADRLAVTRVSVTPGALDAARRTLAFRATLAVAGHPWAYDGAVRLLDRAGHDLSADDDLDQNLLGHDGVSGLRRVVAARPGTGATSLVRADASSGRTIEVLA